GQWRGDPQELAHRAHGAATHLEDLPRLGGRHIDHAIAVAHEDLAGLRLVVAIDGPQERALPRSRRIAEHDALPRAHLEAEPPQYGKRHPAVVVQAQELAQIAHADAP